MQVRPAGGRQRSACARETSLQLHPSTYRSRSNPQTKAARIADEFGSPNLQVAAVLLQRGSTANACRAKACQPASWATRQNSEGVSELVSPGRFVRIQHQSQASFLRRVDPGCYPDRSARYLVRRLDPRRLPDWIPRQKDQVGVFHLPVVCFLALIAGPD